MVLAVLAPHYIHLSSNTDTTVVTLEGREVWVHNIPLSCINMLDFALSPLFYNDNNFRRKPQKPLKPLPTISYNLPRKINCRDSILPATSLLLPVLIVALLLQLQQRKINLIFASCQLYLAAGNQECMWHHMFTLLELTNKIYNLLLQYVA